MRVALFFVSRRFRAEIAPSERGFAVITVSMAFLADILSLYDRDNPPSLYVHIPFCRFRCAYCSFYSEVLAGRAKESHGAYFGRLADEMRTARDYFSKPFPTVYIGGGTPNLSENIRYVGEILELVAGGGEITVECNVSSVTDEQLSLFSERATRLSVGVQSLDPAVRKTLCRFDDTVGLRSLFEWRAAHPGFPTLNLDFITGVSPSDSFPSSFRTFCGNLAESGFEFPEHVSLYLLTVEDGGAYEKLVRRGLRREASEDEAADSLLAGWRALHEAGYEHYEVSAFQRGGHRCRHNMRYWRLNEYLGLGAQAASRSFSAKGSAGVAIRNGQDAFAFSSGKPFEGYEIEPLGGHDVAVEMILAGLRTADGIDAGEFRRRTGRDIEAMAREIAGLKVADGRVRLEEEFFLVSEYYIRKLVERL